MTATGVLSDRQISDMVTDGGIASDVPIVDGQIQPASLDLRIGSKAYRVRASFLAGLGKTVHDKLADFQMHEIELAGGAVLEKGCVYVVPLMERLDLPAGMTAAASAKSSIGRLDLLTRIITDNGIEFDRVPEGYTGPLFAEICPRSFSVVAQPGQMLTQMIFRQGKTLISDDDLMALHRETPIVSGEPVISGGLGFSVDLRPENGDLVGYRAKPHTGVVELAKLAHYAGFFDPGFGWAEAGGSGSRGVLEVRCHEAPFVLEHGQVVGRLVYEKMTETPQQLYGAGIASNYQGQGLKLSKHFKSAE